MILFKFDGIICLVLNLCAKYNRINNAHIWCIQNNDDAQNKKKKRFEKRPDVVIILKLICFALQNYTHAETEAKTDGERDGGETEVVNKSLTLLLPTNNFLFSILYQNQQSHTHTHTHMLQQHLKQIICLIIFLFYLNFFFSFRDLKYSVDEGKKILSKLLWHWFIISITLRSMINHHLIICKSVRQIETE